ncbi:unnamed protein product [Protopolystoma xenopodis]|uniref:Uncharacterized protein n=1 Tax=Protopolystoma xenopodis TaxID=117903 RepID=A0A448X5W8_9PLAT|nr:unnamed protein product [Protopolystoma xenopodis]
MSVAVHTNLASVTSPERLAVLGAGRKLLVCIRLDGYTPVCVCVCICVRSVWKIEGEAGEEINRPTYIRNAAWAWTPDSRDRDTTIQTDRQTDIHTNTRDRKSGPVGQQLELCLEPTPLPDTTSSGEEATVCVVKLMCPRKLVKVAFQRQHSHEPELRYWLGAEEEVKATTLAPVWAKSGLAPNCWW